MAKSFNLQLIISSLDQTSKDFAKLQKNLKLTDKNIKQIAVGGAAVATAFVAATTLMVKKAADFEAQMANVNTMLNAQSEKYLPSLASSIKKMAKNYGEGTETLSTGLYNILSASIPVEKSISVLETSVRAATAGLTDTATSADVLTTILNSYSLSADNATDVSDLLFTIVKRGKTTFGELSGAIGQVASTAASSGLSIEEMGSALATMTRAGINVNVATTSLNAILLAFLKPTKEAKEAAKELGLELNKNTLKSDGLLGVLGKLKNSTNEQQTAIFGNVRALRGLNAIVQQSEGFLEDLDTMYNRVGASSEAFEKQSKTVVFQLKKLKENSNILFVNLGEKLLPAINDVVVGLNENFFPALDKVFELMEENKDIVKTIANNIVNMGKAFIGMQIGGQIIDVIKNLFIETKEKTDELIGSVELLTEDMLGLSETVSSTSDQNNSNIDKQIEKLHTWKTMWALFDKNRVKSTKETNQKIVDDFIEAFSKINAAHKDNVARFTRLIQATEDAFSNSIAGMIKGTESFRDAVSQVMTAVADAIIQEFARAMAHEAVKTILKIITKGAGGIFGSILGGIGSILGFATGVRGTMGGLAVVGERGPELVNLPVGADVMNATETRGMLASPVGAGGSVNNIYVNFSGNSFTGTSDEIAEAISSKLMDDFRLQANVS